MHFIYSAFQIQILIFVLITFWNSKPRMFAAVVHMYIFRKLIFFFKLFRVLITYKLYKLILIHFSLCYFQTEEHGQFFKS